MHRVLKLLLLLLVSLCYFLITRLMVSNILFMFIFLFCSFLFSILCILCFCIVLCIVSQFVLYSCLLPIIIQIYQSLPPLVNPVTVNKYIIYHLYPVCPVAQSV